MLLQSRAQFVYLHFGLMALSEQISFIAEARSQVVKYRCLGMKLNNQKFCFRLVNPTKLFNSINTTVSVESNSLSSS